MRYSFYVALLLVKGEYKVFIPSVREEFEIRSIPSLEMDLNDALQPRLASKTISLNLARKDPIMAVVNQTRRYLRLSGRSMDEYIDTVKVTVITEED